MGLFGRWHHIKVITTVKYDSGLICEYVGFCRFWAGKLILRRRRTICWWRRRKEKDTMWANSTKHLTLIIRRILMIRPRILKAFGGLNPSLGNRNSLKNMWMKIMYSYEHEFHLLSFNVVSPLCVQNIRCYCCVCEIRDLDQLIKKGIMISTRRD